MTKHPLPSAPSAARIDAIIALFRQSKFAEAEGSVQELVRNYPRHPFGWKALGTLYIDWNRFAEAEQHLKKSLELAPDQADAYKALGDVFGVQGQTASAIASYREAIKILPGYAEAHNNLATALKMAGETSAAIESYQQAFQLQADYAEAHFNLGLLYHEVTGEAEKAISEYQSAIKIRPDFADAYYNMAAIYLQTGQVDAAIACYTRALEYNPGDADAWYNLGNTLKENHQLEAAIASYQHAIELRPEFAMALSMQGRCYHELGDPNLSMQAYQRSLELNPGHADTHNQMGLLLHDVAHYHEAIASYTRALAIQPDIAEVWNNMGNTLNVLGCVDEAAANFECAIALKPDMVHAYNNLGTIFRDKGRFDEAIKTFLRSLEINPAYEGAFDNLLFCANYHPDLDGEAIYDYYQAYQAHLGQQMEGAWRPHDNDRILGRRLKVGYVSPSFHRHSQRHFLEPLLSHHDHNQFEIYAYAQITSDDEVTERYQGYVDHWLNTRGMSDDQLAERIRQDGIDILVDIAGHTGHNRLLVFARKPAPVSLHWLDFGYTTGLKAIDYYLGDPVMTPEGSENVFSEQIWRLPVTSYAYRPDPGMGDITVLPAQQNGFITFGTLTRSVRVNDHVVRAWSEILKRVPDSRLIINSGNFKDTAMQERMAERFVAQGISRERLDIGFQSPAWQVLQQMDISLDCFPHNSGTTLFESLYMGVPYITLASRPSVGTLGASVLAAIGHPEWTAQNEADYIEKAVQLAQDVEGLVAIRTGLRSQMQQSPLMDEVGFTRAVEQAYRQMWEKWCSGR